MVGGLSHNGAELCGDFRRQPAFAGAFAMNERDQLTKGDAITIARTEKGVPTLVTARDLVERFHGMVRERDPAGLPTWNHGCGE
jgi:hypothetical protein